MSCEFLSIIHSYSSSTQTGFDFVQTTLKTTNKNYIYFSLFIPFQNGIRLIIAKHAEQEICFGQTIYIQSRIHPVRHWYKVMKNHILLYIVITKFIFGYCFFFFLFKFFFICTKLQNKKLLLQL